MYENVCKYIYPKACMASGAFRLKGADMTSLSEIAHMCHTSTATVSRVLNDPSHQCRDESLAREIRETARNAGYMPNAAARDLKMKKNAPAAAAADILLARFRSLESDYFLRELFESVQCALMQKGFLSGRTYDVPDMQKAIGGSAKARPGKSGNAGKNTGLIILGRCPHELIAPLHASYRHIVAIDRNPTDYELDEIVCDGKQAAVAAMKHLIGLGHKKIAYIGDCSYEARYIGYYEALLDAGIPIDYRLIFSTKQTMEEGADAAADIRAMENRPTALFCANDTTAIGVLQELSRGRKGGYMPSVISIDNIRQSETCHPMLTTIDIPKEEMARLAVAILGDRMDGGHSAYLRVSLPCRLVIRESCHYLY